MNRASVSFLSGRSAGRVSFVLQIFIASCLAISTAPAAVTYELVTVGNPGNANDTTGYGAVNYEYKIGKYEVTIGQYAEFLNAVAKSDPYGLWDSNMETNLSIAGISRGGVSGSYEYAVMTVSGSAPYGGVSNANRPITYVSWFDAARFANWMQNGQGSGSTETGAYTLGGATSGNAVARNPGAQFYIPTENEWYKAAYYSPVKGGAGSTGYYTYATQSDSAPGNMIGSEINQANYRPGGLWSVTQSTSYSSSQNCLTDVGAFTNSASYYGTFDQSGNAAEWNDLTGDANVNRGSRGGIWNQDYAFPLSSTGMRALWSPSYADNGSGFRLASPFLVPEPSTYCMALAGLACGGFSIWRRRKRA